MQIAANPAAALVMDLDAEMRGCAWDLLPMSRYRAHNWHCFGNLPRQPYAAIYTTLGCPYHCSFCCIQAPFKNGEKVLGLGPAVNSYRFWSPDRVVDEIDHLVEVYGIRNIKLADEMFVLNERHVVGICDRLIERARAEPGLRAGRHREAGNARQIAGAGYLAGARHREGQRARSGRPNKRYRVTKRPTCGRTGKRIKRRWQPHFRLAEDNEETMETLDLALELVRV